MRLVPFAAVAVALALLPTAAHAGRGGFLPPMRIDLGPAASTGDRTPAFQVVAGLHWASVYPKAKANIDVGVGFVSTTRGTDDQTDTTGTVRSSRCACDPLSYIGGYVEVGARTGGGSWWRNWISTRVESGAASVERGRHPYVGVATRVSTEVFAVTGGGGSGGIVLGVFAVGLYAEVSARRIQDVGDDLGISAGLSMRIPLIAVN